MMSGSRIHYTAVALLIGGFGALGAGAGAQVALVVFGDAVGCISSVGAAPAGCTAAIDAVQSKVLVFFAGGIVAMLTGGGVLWGASRE